LHGKIRPPDSENLRTLINALETALRFGDGLNRRNPEILRILGMKVDAHALPAVFDLEMWCRQHAREPEILGARRGHEKPVRFRWGEEIDHRLETNEERPGHGSGQRKRHLAATFAALRRRAKEEMLGHFQDRGIGGIGGELRQFALENKVGVIGRRIANLEGTRRNSGNFVQLQGLIIRRRAPRIENQKAERVASESIVAQEALEVGLLDVNLVMNGDSRRRV